MSRVRAPSPALVQVEYESTRRLQPPRGSRGNEEEYGVLAGPRVRAAAGARSGSAHLGRDVGDIARVAQLVEHTLGKGEVTGSIPVASSDGASVESNAERGIRNQRLPTSEFRI